MCCFSVGKPVGWLAGLFAKKVHVSKTNILARMMEPGVQALAYSMNLKAGREVAMVLPLPVVTGSGDDAVRFIDLQAHPKMFEELHELFNVPPPLSRSMPKGGGFSVQRLKVHKVGAFVASYVPTRADFSRLDPQFRLPEVLFDAVPHYADHGFAVFQLAPGKVTVHPMAFTFPTRTPDKLFFPTVHVHDGAFHATADFDHALYYQGTRANGDQAAVMQTHRDYAGLLEKGTWLNCRTLHARLPNEDIWI